MIRNIGLTWISFHYSVLYHLTVWCKQRAYHVIAFSAFIFCHPVLHLSYNKTILQKNTNAKLPFIDFKLLSRGSHHNNTGSTTASYPPMTKQTHPLMTTQTHPLHMLPNPSATIPQPHQHQLGFNSAYCPHQRMVLNASEFSTQSLHPTQFNPPQFNPNYSQQYPNARMKRQREVDTDVQRCYATPTKKRARYDSRLSPIPSILTPRSRSHSNDFSSEDLYPYSNPSYVWSPTINSKSSPNFNGLEGWDTQASPASSSLSLEGFSPILKRPDVGTPTTGIEYTSPESISRSISMRAGTPSRNLSFSFGSQQSESPSVNIRSGKTISRYDEDRQFEITTTLLSTFNKSVSPAVLEISDDIKNILSDRT